MFTYSESFMCLARIVEKFEFQNFKRPIEGPSISVPQIFSFLDICLSWKFDVSSLNN